MQRAGGGVGPFTAAPRCTVHTLHVALGGNGFRSAATRRWDVSCIQYKTTKGDTATMRHSSIEAGRKAEENE